MRCFVTDQHLLLQEKIAGVYAKLQEMQCYVRIRSTTCRYVCSQEILLTFLTWQSVVKRICICTCFKVVMTGRCKNALPYYWYMSLQPERTANVLSKPEVCVRHKLLFQYSRDKKQSRLLTVWIWPARRIARGNNEVVPEGGLFQRCISRPNNDKIAVIHPRCMHSNAGPLISARLS